MAEYVLVCLITALPTENRLLLMLKSRDEYLCQVSFQSRWFWVLAAIFGDHPAGDLQTQVDAAAIKGAAEFIAAPGDYNFGNRTVSITNATTGGGRQEGGERGRGGMCCWRDGKKGG
jgi:hypothetical protein